MSEKVYKKVEVVGASSDSISDAIKNAIDKAEESLDKLKWFEVEEIRGSLEGEAPLFQVTVKIGFRLQ